MATALTLRQNKGSPLTFKEGDDNFLYLDGKIDSVSATTKIYDTKEAGLAATKDSDTFWVIGSGDVAMTLYRRVNSTTATELASSLSTQFKADLADPEKGAGIVEFTNGRSVRDKLSEFVSIKDFKISSDGTERSDNEAGEAMVAYLEERGGGVSFIPRGDYSISLRFTTGKHWVIFEPGVRFYGGAPTSLLSVGPDVEYFNMMGNGVNLWGQEIDQIGTEISRALHAVEVRNRHSQINGIGSAGGSRYDSLYVSTPFEDAPHITFEDCHFAGATRNILSLVNGRNIYFIGCTFSGLRALKGSMLYPMDIERDGAQKHKDIHFIRCALDPAGTTFSSNALVVKDPGDGTSHIGLYLKNFRFKGGSFIRPNAADSGSGYGVITGVFLEDVVVEGNRLFIKDGVAPQRIQAELKNIAVANAELTFDTTFLHGSTLENVKTTTANLSILGHENCWLSNVQSHRDNVPGELGVNKFFVKESSQIAGQQTYLHGAVELSKEGDNTIGLGVTQLVITPPVNRLAVIVEVYLTSQALGSSTSSAQRSQKIVFQMTAGGGNVVFDRIPSLEVGDLLSGSPNTSGGRTPGNFNASLNVVDGKIILACDNSTETGGQNYISLFVRAVGRGASALRFE